MIRNIHMDLATVDTDGVFDGITGAGPWDSGDFNVGNPPDGLAHQLSFVSNADVSGLTFTLTGTDADGNAQTEDVTNVTTSPVETTKYYKTITGLEASATLSSNTLDVGWVDEAVSPSIKLNHDSGLGSNWFLDVTGTIALDVQFTFSDLSDKALCPGQESAWWVEPETSLANESTDSTAVVQADPGWAYARIQVNSYSTGAECRLYLSQALR